MCVDVSCVWCGGDTARCVIPISGSSVRVCAGVELNVFRLILFSLRRDFFLCMLIIFTASGCSVFLFVFCFTFRKCVCVCVCRRVCCSEQCKVFICTQEELWRLFYKSNRSQIISSSVGKVHFLHQLVQSSVHKFENGLLQFIVHNSNSSIVLFSICCCELLFLNNISTAPSGTTESNYLSVLTLKLYFTFHLHVQYWILIQPGFTYCHFHSYHTFRAH